MLGPLLWSLLNAAATVLVPLLLFVVFARSGDPSQVGSVGIAIAILEILKTFCPLGLYEILLRRETTTNEESASLGLLLVSGAVATVLYAALIMVTGRYLPDVAAIAPLLLLLSPKLLFDVASIQPLAALTRQLTFRRLAMRTVIANIISACIGSGLAVLGHALLGLLLYYLLQSVLSFLLTVSGRMPLVRPSLRITPLRRLLRETGYASAVRIVAGANTYADTLVISTFVPAALVGIYNIGKRIETMLISASSSFGAILYQPLFANRAAVEHAGVVANAVRITTLFFGVPVIVFVSFQRDWIGWVFGNRWIDAAPVCGLLALSGLARIYGSIHGSLLSVSGRNRTLLAYSSASTIVGLSSVAAFSSFGIVWVAAAIAVKSWLFCILSAYLTRRESRNVASTYLLHAICPLLGCTMLAFGAGSVVSHAYPAGIAGIPTSVLAITASITSIAIFLTMVYRRDVIRVGLLVRLRLARSRAVSVSVP